MDQMVLEMLTARLDKIEEKVDRILAFKWQLIGGSVVLSMILTVALNIAAIIYSRGG